MFTSFRVPNFVRIILDRQEKEKAKKRACTEGTDEIPPTKKAALTPSLIPVTSDGMREDIETMVQCMRFLRQENERLTKINAIWMEERTAMMNKIDALEEEVEEVDESSQVFYAENNILLEKISLLEKDLELSCEENKLLRDKVSALEEEIFMDLFF
jgi:hypothetical protein